MPNINLTVNWVGETGPDIKYKVGYRLNGTTNPYVYASPDVSVTSHTFSGIPAGTYDISVTSICGGIIGSTVYTLGGSTV